MLIITYVLELSTEIGTVWVLKILLFFLIWGYFIIHQVFLPPWVALYHFKKTILVLLAWAPEEDFLFRWCPITPRCRLLSYSVTHPLRYLQSLTSPACGIIITQVNDKSSYMLYAMLSNSSLMEGDMLSPGAFGPALNKHMDNWYDWDSTDAPEWSLYREWCDPEVFGEREVLSGGFTDD